MDFLVLGMTYAECQTDPNRSCLKIFMLNSDLFFVGIGLLAFLVAVKIIYFLVDVVTDVLPLG